MPQPSNGTFGRNTSKTVTPGLSRAHTVAASSTIHPITPVSATPSKRHRGRRLTSLFERRHGRKTDLDMLTPSTQALGPPTPPPTISKLAKAFVDSLNTYQLSDFLVWMLYHDVVELPDSPTAWYQPINKLDMRGWVALGEFLLNTSKAIDTSYGFDLVVLDSICDRIGLQCSTVHSLLIQFADPEKMAYSQIATVVNQAVANFMTKVEIYEAVRAKLQELEKLASRQQPTHTSEFEVWHAQVVKHIRDLLKLVVEPRIANLRSGTPLVTAATAAQLPKDVKDGIKLTYAYEAMQPKRQVPLHRYGIYPDLQIVTPPPSPPHSEEVERARLHAMQLLADNHDLRAQVDALQDNKKELEKSNEKLAVRFHKLQRSQPREYVEVPDPNDVFTSSRANRTVAEDVQDCSSKQPQPLSNDGIAPQPFTPLLTRQRSTVLSQNYDDIFSGLDTPPTPPVRLSAPATGGLLEPNVPRRVGRRSGLIFTSDQKNLLAAIRGVDGEDEDWEGGEVRTPTPAGRK